MSHKEMMIAPSVLAADFSRLGEAAKIAEESGADWLHLDVMDGQFVPPITFGAQAAAALRPLTRLPFDAHLMVDNPANQIAAFADAGVDRLTFHIEVEIHAHKLLSDIRGRGLKAGISIVPSTPVTAVSPLLGDVDHVLVMTVNPGWGGQSLIHSTLGKVEELARLRRSGAGDFLIVIDGGFGPSTAASVWNSGADVAVMGSAFYGAENPAGALASCRTRS